jgi:hypothetical protein
MFGMTRFLIFFYGEEAAIRNMIRFFPNSNIRIAASSPLLQKMMASFQAEARNLLIFVAKIY